MAKKIPLDLSDFLDVTTYLYNRPDKNDSLAYPEAIEENFGIGRPADAGSLFNIYWRVVHPSFIDRPKSIMTEEPVEASEATGGFSLSAEQIQQLRDIKLTPEEANLLVPDFSLPGGIGTQNRPFNYRTSGQDPLMGIDEHTYYKMVESLGNFITHKEVLSCKHGIKLNDAAEFIQRLLLYVAKLSRIEGNSYTVESMKMAESILDGRERANREDLLSIPELAIAMNIETNHQQLEQLTVWGIESSLRGINSARSLFEDARQIKALVDNPKIRQQEGEIFAEACKLLAGSLVRGSYGSAVKGVILGEESLSKIFPPEKLWTIKLVRAQGEANSLIAASDTIPDSYQFDEAAAQATQAKLNELKERHHKLKDPLYLKYIRHFDVEAKNERPRLAELEKIAYGRYRFSPPHKHFTIYKTDDWADALGELLDAANETFSKSQKEEYEYWIKKPNPDNSYDDRTYGLTSTQKIWSYLNGGEIRETYGGFKKAIELAESLTFDGSHKGKLEEQRKNLIATLNEHFTPQPDPEQLRVNIAEHMNMFRDTSLPSNPEEPLSLYQAVEYWGKVATDKKHSYTIGQARDNASWVIMMQNLFDKVQKHTGVDLIHYYMDEERFKRAIGDVNLNMSAVIADTLGAPVTTEIKNRIVQRPDLVNPDNKTLARAIRNIQVRNAAYIETYDPGDPIAWHSVLEAMRSNISSLSGKIDGMQRELTSAHRIDPTAIANSLERILQAVKQTENLTQLRQLLEEEREPIQQAIKFMVILQKEAQPDASFVTVGNPAPYWPEKPDEWIKLVSAAEHSMRDHYENRQELVGYGSVFGQPQYRTRKNTFSGALNQQLDLSTIRGGIDAAVHIIVTLKDKENMDDVRTREGWIKEELQKVRQVTDVVAKVDNEGNPNASRAADLLLACIELGYPTPWVTETSKQSLANEHLRAQASRRGQCPFGH